MGDLVLSADFGTSGVKLCVVDGALAIRARTIEPYPTDFCGPGCAEQAPEDWWRALARGVALLKEEVPDLAARVECLAFCAQMCGLVCADAGSAPLRPALIWLDKRSAGIARALVGGFPAIRGYQMGKLATWLRLANGAPARNGMDPPAKMLWVARHEPEVWAATHRLLDVGGWLVARATGEFVATPEAANLTWLMDTRPGREGWSPRLMRLAGIDGDRLPRIVQGTDEVGRLTARAASELGLDASTVVLGGTGDVTAAALGSGAVGDGELHVCASTGAWIGGFFPRRIISVTDSYATVTSGIGCRPLLIAAQENAGSALEWVARMVSGGALAPGDIGRVYADIGARCPDDPFLLPWFAGERVPVDDSRLRGVFHGLALGHDRNALLRAAVEGVALNIAWAFGRLARSGLAGATETIPLVGGAAANPQLAQALADVLGRTVAVRESRYAGALGAATLAAPRMGWGGTVWESTASIARQEARTYAPDAARAAALAVRAEKLARIRQHMLRSLPGTGTRPDDRRILQAPH